MYFSDKYFFYFVILIEWMFVVCTNMHFDIQYSFSLLHIVLASAMMDKKKRKKNAVVAILDTLHAFDSNFYNAALYVPNEGPCSNSLLSKD